jgi:hypothetical protein
LLRQKARDAVIVPEREGLQRLFSLKQEFPDEWYRFLHPAGETSSATLDLGVERFPFRYRTREIDISEVQVYVNPRVEVTAELPLDLSLTAPGDEPNFAADQVVLNGTLGSLRSGSKAYSGKGPGTWRLSAAPLGASSLADTISDVTILCRYSVSALQVAP